MAGRRWFAVVASAATAVALVAGCTSTAAVDAPSAGSPTASGPAAPTSTAPISPPPTSPPRTTAVAAARCPWLDLAAATDRIGMRLDRITVLRAGARTVGCRFYAVQGESYNQSEHLPGPRQPVIDIVTTRYPSAVAAHNAFVLASRSGRHQQSETITAGNLGVCFQVAFYKPDHGRDWACAFSVGRTAVVIFTVVTSPALTVVTVAAEVAARL